MIRAGGAELMCDDITQFGKTSDKADGEELDVKAVVDEFGVHLNPMLDFFGGISEVSACYEGRRPFLVRRGHVTMVSLVISQLLILI